MIDHSDGPAVANILAPYNPQQTIFGGIASSTITTTPHIWLADSSGLYHAYVKDAGTGQLKAADLATEWQHAYQVMLSGDAAQIALLTPLQHLEGNAEAVFENTSLSKLSGDKLARDREDVQREYDAIVTAMKINQTLYGTDPTAALTNQTYLEMEKTLQANVDLEELAMQGHGLNNSGMSKYNGYTNDFQHNVDKTTLFVGNGLNHNENALTDFFDDSVLSHAPYAVVVHNGVLTQLNQNAALETSLDKAVVALDNSMFFKTYTKSDFSTVASTATNNSSSPADAIIHNLRAQPPGTFLTIYDEYVSTSVTHVAGSANIEQMTAHDWKLGKDMQFHTTTDLTAEWKHLYALLSTGHGNELTPMQRLEANAEAVFENTRLSGINPVKEARDREDAQRQFDVMGAALTKLGLNDVGSTKHISDANYLKMVNLIQADNLLHELGMQGHGLNHPPSSQYAGYTTQFQNGVDKTTLYVGGGLDNNENALTHFFDDSLLTHAPFAVAVRNGKLEQLNQNGNREDTLHVANAGMNSIMFDKVLTAKDFKHV